MKKIFLLGSIMFFQYSYSQTAQSNYEKCMKSIESWYSSNPIEKKYLEELPPLKPGQVYLACDGWFHQRCILHKRVCWCDDCAKAIKKEKDILETEYERKKTTCENTYKRELAEENAKAERERKAAEEKRLKEEKERLEKERKEKAEKEKSNLADDKKKSNSSKTKNNSTYVDPKILEMQARYQEQRRKDSIENVLMGTAIATTGAGMLTMSDKELNRKEEDYEIGTYLKAIVGLGWKFIPLISNMNYSNPNRFVSQEATESFTFIEGSFQLAAFNRDFISWKISPYGYFGLNAFNPGSVGTHLCYGGSSSLGFGKKFKILLQSEYLKRSGNMTIDNAVYFIDSKGTVSYNYSTLKYGPGIQLRIGDADSWGGSTEYSLSAFKEELSFLKGQNRNVYSFQFKISAKICTFFVEYAPDYPAAGEVLFPNNYIKSKESLMNMAIAVPLTLFYN